MESTIIYMRQKISSVTTGILVKGYVGLSVALTAGRSGKPKKRRNDFKIRKTIALNKLTTSANTP